MSAITSVQLAPMIAKLFAAEAIPQLRDALYMPQLVNRDYDTAFANEGDTIQIGIAPGMVANDMAEGGSVQPQNPAYGQTELVLNRHKEATWQLPDVTKILANPTVVRDLMNAQMIALAEAIEDDVMANFVYLTSNTPQGAAGVNINEAVVDALETTLFQAKVPVTIPKILLVNPAAYADIRQIGRFTERRMIGGIGEAIRTGQVDSIKGFAVVRSNRIPFVAGAPNTNYNLAFAPQAITLAMRRLPAAVGSGAVTEYATDPVSGYAVRVTTSYNPNVLAMQVTVDVLYGTSVLRPEFAVQLIN